MLAVAVVRVLALYLYCAPNSTCVACSDQPHTANWHCHNKQELTTPPRRHLPLPLSLPLPGGCTIMTAVHVTHHRPSRPAVPLTTDRSTVDFCFYSCVRAAFRSASLAAPCSFTRAPWDAGRAVPPHEKPRTFETTCTHTRMHTCMHTRKRASTHASTQARTHASTQARTPNSTNNKNTLQVKTEATSGRLRMLACK